jgi:hypothetical protein
MRRRPSSIGLLASCVLVISSVTMSTGTAESAPSNHRVVPIRFLHRTQPSAARVDSVSSGDTGFAAELADRPNLKRLPSEEPGLTGEQGLQPVTSVPSSPNVPIGSGKPTKSFEGLNHFRSRYSDGGNQYSGEPPDQGLCAGNGRVLEVVNSVVQVYTPSGSPLIEGEPAFPQAGPVGLSLTEFYGLPSEFVRPDGPFGPLLFDISCLFDPEGQRWFMIADELAVDPPTGGLTGPTAVLVAVSATANPLGAWNVYAIDTTNNGTNGTPDHGCSSGFCFGDYPQSGLDANGLFISTNEYDNLGDGEFHGAQLYSVSKADLEAGDATPTSVYFENVFSGVANSLAFTLQPANGLAGDWDPRAGGTMYFGMSLAWVTDPDPADGVSLWALRNTASLDAGNPTPQLAETRVATEDYLVTHNARQMGGKTPLLKCVNMGVDCIGTDYRFIPSPIPLDTGSAKIRSAWLHNGVVYLTTMTELKGQGAANYDRTDGSWVPINRRVGVAYFGIRPAPGGTLSASLTQQGYVAVARNNLIYPSIAIGSSGRGAIGVTLTGIDYNPSAAYIPFQVGQAPTSVQIGGLGVGPNDGFTGTGEGGFRPRWGDYGAATVSESGSVWIAAEYIAQQCGFQQWLNDPTCGFRRTFFANWSTRLFRLPT